MGVSNKDDLAFLVVLLPPPRCWGYKCAQSCTAHLSYSFVAHGAWRWTCRYTYTHGSRHKVPSVFLYFFSSLYFSLESFTDAERYHFSYQWALRMCLSWPPVLGFQVGTAIPECLCSAGELNLGLCVHSKHVIHWASPSLAPFSYSSPIVKLSPLLLITGAGSCYWFPNVKEKKDPVLDQDVYTTFSCIFSKIGQTKSQIFLSLFPLLLQLFPHWLL